MTKKQRFLIATGLSAAVWIAALFYSMGAVTYAPGAYGWIRVFPHPLLVMAVTLLATGISAALWRWYRRDRVASALAALNAEEREQLRAQLAAASLELHADGEYEVVYTPRKAKYDQE
ncbi:MAG: hypothetical protein HXY40_18110 [Chloroflexi bacterium]|nr:hypothetical protein [Chloroflexota bacterium]